MLAHPLFNGVVSQSDDDKTQEEYGLNHEGAKRLQTDAKAYSSSALVTANEGDGDSLRVAIVLSAGYFGFFAHAGFMLAIEELEINYCAISGSSAGAIVAALHASGVPASEIIETLSNVSRRDFWDSTGIKGLLGALARKGRGWTGWLKGDLFEKLIHDNLRAKSFEECSRSLYITALNLSAGTDETFHTGAIADKVRASGSYPFLIAPKVIDGSYYWDGGFLSKVPIEKLLEIEKPDRVLIHYLSTRESDADFSSGKWAAVTLLEKALSSARREIETHRLKALDSHKDKLIWIEPVVPRVGPKDLSEGRAAAQAAYLHAMKHLTREKIFPIK